MFLSRDRFPFPFSPVQMSGDGCRPRSRGRGDSRQVTIETKIFRATGDKQSLR